MGALFGERLGKQVPGLILILDSLSAPDRVGQAAQEPLRSLRSLYGETQHQPVAD
jgi:hypothetical protein